MNVERLRRLLLLVPLAWRHRPHGIPVHDALQALQIDSLEQLTDDADLLTSIGQPSGTPDTFVEIYVEGDRVKVELPQVFIHPPRFTAIEAAALLGAIKPLQEAGIDSIAAAVEKLHAAFPAREDDQDEAKGLAHATRIETAPPPAFKELLDEAIDEHLEIELDYFALARGEAARRRLWPRVLRLNTGNWYLAAWDPEQGEEHLYRLDRMSDVRLGSQHFEPKPGPPDGTYELDRLYVPSGEEQEVELRFSPRVADRVVQEWGEIAVRQPDGFVTIRTLVAGDNYLVSWVLGYGGDAELLRPAHLRDALASRVAELRAMYATAEKASR